MLNQAKPPDVVFTGAACAGCLFVGKGLLICTGCRRAWYCDKLCQKEHWQEHKAICKATGEVISSLIKSINKAGNPVSSYKALYYVVIEEHGIARLLKGNLFTCISSRMMQSTVCCHVCFRIREQLPAGSQLVCCPTCRWGWCCKEHWPQHQEEHKAVCAEYRASTCVQLLQYEHVKRHGTPVAWCPERTVDEMPQRLPESWEQYFAWREAPDVIDAFLLAISGPLSLPLTAMQGLLACYSYQQLEQVKELELAVLGAAAFEVMSCGSVVEELMHLMPHISALHVTFIGPELKVLLASDSPSKQLKTGCCPACTAADKKRSYSYFKGTYHKYAGSRQFVAPTIAIACNSGMYEQHQESWTESIRAMLQQKVFMVFTSYNEEEARGDAAVLRAAGATIIRGPEVNPYGSMVPHVDPAAGLDKFFRENHYWMCAGTADAAAAIAAAAPASLVEEGE